MAKITWDNVGERTYETGVDHGVLYLLENDAYSNGVAWNGLTSITESPSGAEPTAFWADNIKYLNLLSAEDFGCTVEAYTYPDEFMECDGSSELATGIVVHQQTRKIFGLCYRTLVGNDVQGNELGYKLHLIYGCLASPSEKNFTTVNETPELITFSWSISTTPVPVTDPQTGAPVPGFKPTAYLEIDSTKTDATKLASLEAILYGGENTNPRLPLPGEVRALFA